MQSTSSRNAAVKDNSGTQGHVCSRSSRKILIRTPLSELPERAERQLRPPASVPPIGAAQLSQIPPDQQFRRCLRKRARQARPVTPNTNCPKSRRTPDPVPLSAADSRTPSNLPADSVVVGVVTYVSGVSNTCSEAHPFVVMSVVMSVVAVACVGHHLNTLCRV